MSSISSKEEEEDDDDTELLTMTQNNNPSNMEEEELAYGEFESAPKKSRRNQRDPSNSSLIYSDASIQLPPSFGNNNNNSYNNNTTIGHHGIDDRRESIDDNSAQLSASYLSQSLQGSWYFQQASSAPSPSPGDGQTGAAAAAAAGQNNNHHGLPPHLSYWLPHHPPERDVSDVTYSGNYDGYNYNYNPYAAPPGQPAPGHPLATKNNSNTNANNSPTNTNANNKSNKQSKPIISTYKEKEYKVYSSRWIMLLYMSLLNLLSDWTCYSVAPIALLTVKAFGDVDPESLVTVFLSANAVASACEPAILGRLGLRRTVIFGAMLLMAGSIVKSGGIAFGGDGGGGSNEGHAHAAEEETDETWRLYLGFFLVGLSQPLYQCTPALLSASWFPENERTMATGVALNSNQLGIGCAFVFGTMLVSTEEDIIPYFGLLSIISTITFVGAALQFDDAPPTPPSDTARVIKGSLEVKIPDLFKAFGGLGGGGGGGGNEKHENDDEDKDGKSGNDGGNTNNKNNTKGEEKGASMEVEGEAISSLIAAAPSPASGDEPVASSTSSGDKRKSDDNAQSAPTNQPLPSYQIPPPAAYNMYHPLHAPPPYPPPGVHPLHAAPPHPLQQPYMMPPPGQGYYYPPLPPPMGPYGYPAYGNNPAQGIKHTEHTPTFYHGYDQEGHYHNALLENAGYDDYDDYHFDEGVEPIMTQLDHHLDIDVRDDQIWLSFKACFARPGFAHCVVAFTTSGIIINTLSTYMDYLVTLEGAGAEYVGIVGGTFQLLIMASSLVIGGWTDHSRKYYFVILAMLITGAFALSVCNVNLDSDAGGDLRLNLLVVAVLTGPLQPISTELGVEVVYPLSENTVLVIQQLFSNLLSAAFIPVFKMLKDVGTAPADEVVKSMFEVPQYTFSFYMLIIIHACSTAYFATFNGKYLRYDAELLKKKKNQEDKDEHERLISMQDGGYGSTEGNMN